jgi:hypothetical protein
MTDAPTDTGADCPSCRQPVASGQQFCSSCGAQLSSPALSNPGFSNPGFSNAPVDSPVGDADFPSTPKLIAVILTIFAPFISLIAALVLRSSERSPIRRATLRTWAIASGAWLALGLLIVIIAAASIGSAVSRDTPSTSGPCVGGPEMGADGVPLGHDRFRFPCADGGSTVVHF